MLKVWWDSENKKHHAEVRWPSYLDHLTQSQRYCVHVHSVDMDTVLQEHSK